MPDGAGTVPMSVRSRLTFERQIRQPLEDSGVAPALAHAVTEALMIELLGESAKAKKAKSSDGEEKRTARSKKGADAEGSHGIASASAELQTNQVTVLGRPEVEFLLAEAKELARVATDPDKVKSAVKDRFTKEWKENLRRLRVGAGLDAALFGRMVTSDILARTDAAIHVAHAMTVHAEAAETDYFAATDDLLGSGPEAELGSGHIGNAELTTGLFYGYAVVDVPLLISNLEGCARSDWESANATLARHVVKNLVHMLATVSPGAKIGSTAPYSFAHLVAIEAGNAQPRTLANAFLKPVSMRPDAMANAFAALAGHWNELDETYGRKEQRALAALGDATALSSSGAERMPLPMLAAWASAQVGKEA